MLLKPDTRLPIFFLADLARSTRNQLEHLPDYHVTIDSHQTIELRRLLYGDVDNSELPDPGLLAILFGPQLCHLGPMPPKDCHLFGSPAPCMPFLGLTFRSPSSWESSRPIHR